jgi:hypothetical protein
MVAFQNTQMQAIEQNGKLIILTFDQVPQRLKNLAKISEHFDRMQQQKESLLNILSALINNIRKGRFSKPHLVWKLTSPLELFAVQLKVN